MIPHDVKKIVLQLCILVKYCYRLPMIGRNDCECCLHAVITSFKTSKLQTHGSIKMNKKNRNFSTKRTY